ncbi:D-lyxose/D-mannose family sugar isomerase [Eremococcus coleocola]|uniref:D-lyxose/D-mannose family sugar isomerase n=1 Tax=Eremococcus coleocola TaxID=88132 RepID=UPI0004269F61|nr:D-lyxose/D-mannose family sugar isomerase [Eremococcus coleocola]
MIKEEYKKKVIELFNNSGMSFTKEEIDSIEFADFGLDDIDNQGLNLIVYENNDRYCAKEMVLLPNQYCPEHKHPNFKEKLGKQETFRCRKGEVFLFVEDMTNGREFDVFPKFDNEYYTIDSGIKLIAGEQYTIMPNKRHWFVAGPSGAIISEFSSTSDDATDIFTNPNVNRIN